MADLHQKGGKEQDYLCDFTDLWTRGCVIVQNLKLTMSQLESHIQKLNLEKYGRDMDNIGLRRSGREIPPEKASPKAQ